jgi:anti-sigma B factor antagonist
MQISEERTADVLTVGLKGRLDASTSKSVEDFLLKQIDAGSRLFVLDLGGLEYISSVGLRVFMMAAKRLKVVKGKIVVCSLSAPIKEVFEISGFTSLFPMFDDRAAAVKGVA